MSNDNLKLWIKVEKTNPKYTKKANVKGISITSISPQYQIKNVTEQFGIYGQTWGFKKLDLDYSLVEVLGLVIVDAVFYFPNGEFPIKNSISVWRDNAKTKVDDNFAKKIETDTLTKAISKIGFNADIFMGLFDDVRYIESMNEEFNKLSTEEIEAINKKIDDCLIMNESEFADCKTLEEAASLYKNIIQSAKKDNIWNDKYALKLIEIKDAFKNNFKK